MRYKEYLQSTKWKSKKRAALRIAEHRCQVCNFNGNLDVHHRKYPEVLGEEPDSDLIALCRQCHDVFHRAKRFVIPSYMTHADLKIPYGANVVEVSIKSWRK